jgi:hypothetical protein
MNDWDKIQKWLVGVIIATGTIGFGVMFAMWISL